MCARARARVCVRVCGNTGPSPVRYRSLRVGSCWMLGLVGAIFLQQLFDFLLSPLLLLFFPPPLIHVDAEPRRCAAP